jgi:hypothetical protein
MDRRAWAVPAVALAGFAASLGLTGCSTMPCYPAHDGLPACDITAAQVSSRPEAHLLIPGARNVTFSAADEGQSIDSATIAQADHGFTADLDAATVLAWYDVRLRARGFVQQPVLHVGRGDDPWYEWLNGRQIFVLSEGHEADGSVVYGTQYEIVRSSGPTAPPTAGASPT